MYGTQQINLSLQNIFIKTFKERKFWHYKVPKTGDFLPLSDQNSKYTINITNQNNLHLIHFELPLYYNFWQK